MEISEPEPLQQLDRTFVRFRGRKLSYFSGCDYFRLASHPRVVAALQAAVERHGINVAASRLTTGNHRLYQALEAALAEHFQAPDALLVPTGYISNLVVAEALAGQFSHALIDSRAHPSLRAAAHLLNCAVLEFAHRDSRHMKQRLQQCGRKARIILLTDGMFAHDGSAAPLHEYLEFLPAEATLLVDDAHGAGVLGEHGRGTPEHCGVGRRRLVQTATLSKAFGVYGGVVLGTRKIRDQILRRSHIFVGSTPFPLPLAAAATESVALLQAGGVTLRRRLAAHTASVRTRLRAEGVRLPDHPGPIVLLFPANARQAPHLKSSLLQAGIYPPLIKYPGGPSAGYLRFVFSSEHSEAQLDSLVAALRAVLACVARP